eukprot:6358414-Heterocapsa_arctica.AAC.1
MTGCMNEQKRLDERPHRIGHSREVAPNKPGRNKMISGEHNGISHNFGMQKGRHGSEKKNNKEADWSN